VSVDVSRLTWQLVVLVALVLGAYVALSLAGVDTGQLATIVAGLVGGGGVVAHQAVRLDRQDKALAKITKQTNGVLDQRIEDGATAAITGVLRRAGFKIPDDD
jgi:hypothetical protein